MNEVELLKEQIKVLRELVEAQKQTIDILRTREMFQHPLVLGPQLPSYPNPYLTPNPPWNPPFIVTYDTRELKGTVNGDWGSGGTHGISLNSTMRITNGPAINKN